MFCEFARRFFESRFRFASADDSRRSVGLAGHPSGHRSTVATATETVCPAPSSRKPAAMPYQVSLSPIFSDFNPQSRTSYLVFIVFQLGTKFPLPLSTSTCTELKLRSWCSGASRQRDSSADGFIEAGSIITIQYAVFYYVIDANHLLLTDIVSVLIFSYLQTSAPFSTEV